jgi:hypothetical protein
MPLRRRIRRWKRRLAAWMRRWAATLDGTPSRSTPRDAAAPRREAGPPAHWPRTEKAERRSPGSSREAARREPSRQRATGWPALPSPFRPGVKARDRFTAARKGPPASAATPAQVRPPPTLPPPRLGLAECRWRRHRSRRRRHLRSSWCRSRFADRRAAPPPTSADAVHRTRRRRTVLGTPPADVEATPRRNALPSFRPAPPRQRGRTARPRLSFHRVDSVLPHASDVPPAAWIDVRRTSRDPESQSAPPLALRGRAARRGRSGRRRRRSPRRAGLLIPSMTRSAQSTSSSDFPSTPSRRSWREPGTRGLPDRGWRADLLPAQPEA